MSSLVGQHIVLGITAGVAAYKTPALVRALRAAGAEIQVVMSTNAKKFVTPTTLQAVSGQPVRDDLWDAQAEATMGHIELARWADQILIAPATANCIAALARGQAYDLLTTMCLATEAQVVVAPAMNQRMYLHAATQQNLSALERLGYQIIDPDHGEQACGEFGPGRLPDPEILIDALTTPTVDPEIASVFAGLSVMVTAGPTREAIDPVRFISNHSSGLQGLSLAEAALNAGAQVTLVAGPGVPACNPAINRVDVISATDMHTAVQNNLHGVHLFIGVAAVADYRVAKPAEQKIKKKPSYQSHLDLRLIENPDIIASVVDSDQELVVIGFAAETHDTLNHARDKRQRKGLHAIVVNDVSDARIGFNSPDNATTFITDNAEVSLPRQSKQAIANNLLQQITDNFGTELAGLKDS
ncbi:MAG: bifunctional phosphopantothenoylcysteine decarboxylase/phosphopantothenate--cysteine ligase CoaBC [Pseudomonadota bacterium]|nr:bifunctional phosphopantothenoylcysteine decarboxylase/phosphopantothenate--cysteine ligase CoaBC [Pseudomonadota bacterium]